MTAAMVAPACAARAADAAREDDIARAKAGFLAARSPAARARAWATLQRLIRERSPEQVARMEIERGLR